MWVYLALLSLLFELIVELYLEYRQLKNLERATGPDPLLQKEITDEDFAKSKAYDIAVSRFHFISGIYASLISVASLFLLSMFWRWTAFARREVFRTIVVTFITTIFDAVLALPTSWYRVFVIETEYGFNNTTKGLWVRDHVLQCLVSFGIGSVLLSGLSLIYNLAGKHFALIGIVFLFIIQISLNVLFPILILPLFTKLTPLDDGELRTAVIGLSEKCQFPVKQIYMSDDSKRSSKQNAFVFGLFTRSIGLADTLLEKCSVADIIAIIGHEIGHSKHHHMWKMLIIGQISLGFALVSLDRIMHSPAIFESFGFVGEQPLVIGMSLLTWLAIPIMKIMQVPLNLIQQWFEFQADAFSASQGLKIDEALVKLSIDNKAVIDPDPIYTAFSDSHPTLSQRVRRAREVLAKVK
jgi:STE24 endopeptidase